MNILKAAALPLFFFLTSCSSTPPKTSEEGAQLVEVAGQGWLLRIPSDLVAKVHRNPGDPSALDEIELDGHESTITGRIFEWDRQYLMVRLPEAGGERTAEQAPRARVLSEEDRVVASAAGRGALLGLITRDSQAISGVSVRAVLLKQTSFLGISSVARPKTEPEAAVTTTDANGRFRLELKPGPYEISIKLAGNDRWIRRLSDSPDAIIEASAETELDFKLDRVKVYR